MDIYEELVIWTTNCQNREFGVDIVKEVKTANHKLSQCILYNNANVNCNQK